MEDILASIRRILNEDDAAAPKPVAAVEPEPPALAAADEREADDDTLVLDMSMMVPEEPPSADPPDRPVAQLEAPPVPIPAPVERRPEPLPMVDDATESLVAPEAARVASSSIASLVTTLASERAQPVFRGGPTIEDLVREEIRPLLKLWLDTHLPPLVERLVRAEIERVINRATP